MKKVSLIISMLVLTVSVSLMDCNNWVCRTVNGSGQTVLPNAFSYGSASNFTTIAAANAQCVTEPAFINDPRAKSCDCQPVQN